MRLISIAFLLIFCLSCTSTKKTTTKANILNGTWVPIKQEFGGKLLPDAAFKNQKLILTDTAYSFIAESTDNGVVKYTDNKMDIYGKVGVNSGKHFTAIYKFENGQLTICYNLKGDSYPDSFETKDKPMYFLSVFKRME